MSWLVVLVILGLALPIVADLYVRKIAKGYSILSDTGQELSTGEETKPSSNRYLRGLGAVYAVEFGLFVVLAIVVIVVRGIFGLVFG